MNNQMIGITGVFALIFFLLVLRHFILSLGRPKRKRYDSRATPPARYESAAKVDEDDSWLSWFPDPDQRTGSSKHTDGL